MNTEAITEIPAPRPKPPARVRGATTILAFLAIYGVGMGSLVYLAGLFVGSQVLVPGAVHVGFGVALLVCRGAIVRRRRWARWLGLLLAGCLVMLPPFWVAVGAGSFRTRDLAFPAVLAVGGLALGGNLATRSAREWCSG